jgi:TolB-like protein
MKKLWISLLLPFLLIALLASCISLQDKELTGTENPPPEILGRVNVEFTSTQILHIIRSGSIKEEAYSLLREEARGIFPARNIDIRNISIRGSVSGWNFVWVWLYFIDPVLFNVQSVRATGDVVLVGTPQAAQTAVRRTTNAATGTEGTGNATAGIEGAVNRASESLMKNLPDNTTVAIVSISSRDRENAVFVMDELEFLFVDSGYFKVVDRKTLDQVRSEQNFQMSGEVDDNSAVNIGKMLGANIVVTGTITSAGGGQRLSLKALDVMTAQIIAMAREQF